MASQFRSKVTKEEVAKTIENFVNGGRGIGTTSSPFKSPTRNLKQLELNAYAPNPSIRAAQTNGVAREV
jgi:hypothetical protein